jgi:hypothetical protein
MHFEMFIGKYHTASALLNMSKYSINNIRVTSTHTYLPMKMEQSVPKRRHIKFRRRGITQKKAYNI